MRIIFILIFSLYSFISVAQDSVTFVNKKTGKEFKLYEPTFCNVKMKGNITYGGIYVQHHDSVLTFGLINRWFGSNKYMEEATKIQKNKNLKRKEKRQAIMYLMYTDTTRFKYNNIKRIKIFRTDKYNRKILRYNF